ncbi:MAG: elongation factor P [Candidatus Omnitrophica bacterium]|nr:elongation factor P [Candidatus Omnitrophota bacterium]
MTISINQVASGIALNVDGNLYLVTDYQHVKPGKGSAFVRIKLKNIKTDQVVERTYKTADKLDDVPLEERKLQNLYRSGDGYHFMDYTTYEEVVVTEDILGDNVKFLKENLEIEALSLNEKVLKVILPTFVEMEITHTEPGFKGDTSRAGTKPATIETDATIQVPLFIEIEDMIKIDTRTGEYVERVKK